MLSFGQPSVTGRSLITGAIGPILELIPPLSSGSTLPCMAGLITAPEILANAAGDVESIGSAINAGGSAAAGSTTGVLAAAEDEVSKAISALFSEYAQDYHAALKQAAAFHTEFTRALAAAGAAYTQAEAAAIQTLLGTAQTGTTTSGAFGTLTSMLTTPSTPVTSLIMNGTGFPTPDPFVVSVLNDAYIVPRFPGAIGQGLTTPEQLWPAFGDLTFGQSVAKGAQILNDALFGPTGVITSGNHAVVFGYSQSAVLTTEEIKTIMALPDNLRPDPSQLSFVLLGNLNNPDGGFFSRYPGFYIPWLDIPFNGATPPNSPYPTFIYTNQYDGFTHNPQYPLNFLSDLNAFMGLTYEHGSYPFTAADVAKAIPLPTSPGYTGNTHYYMFLTQNLPLLEGLRNFPIGGNVLADLIQPDMRVLVDMGYGSMGTGGDYADIPTPASLFHLINPVTVGVDLARGAVQGGQAALVDIGALPQTSLPDIYPYVPSIDPGLSINLGQSSVTGLSRFVGALGSLLELIPPGNL